MDITQPTHRSSAKGNHSRIGQWISLVAVLLLSIPLLLRPAQAEIFDQYQVKAVFLYNLTNFIAWPPANGSDGKKPFVIAVLGRNNLHPYLEKAVGGESIKGRQVVIKHYRTLDDLQQRPGDLLFISEDQMAIWPQIRTIARRHGILTVSEVKGFAHRGGVVNLLTLGRKIHIEVNISEARRNGFDISAKLLRLARIVNSEKEE